MPVCERIEGLLEFDVSDALDRDVEIEKDLPILIVPRQAQDPENRARRNRA
jgi:hypothetical protein